MMTAVEMWRTNKGIGTFVSIKNDDKVVIEILERIYEKQKGTTIIVVPDLNVRYAFMKTLKSSEIVNNLINNRDVKVFTEEYIDYRTSTFHNLLTILYNPSKLEYSMIHMLMNSTFKLTFLSTVFKADELMELYKVCPKLQVNQEETIITPLNEVVSVTLEEKDRQLYDYYTKEITDTLTIFGSYENTTKALKGDEILNLSGIAFCDKIARESGWHEGLDKTSPFEMQIDEAYNPINLRNRAIAINEHIRKRKQLLSGNRTKLSKIEEIVNNNPQCKICIINYDTDFAKVIVDFLNENGDIARNYHDKLEPVALLDEEGNQVTYKSGIKQGQVKFAGADLQKSINVNLFNNGEISVLCTNNMPDKKLSIKADIVILSSPYSETIDTYIYRVKSLVNGSNTPKCYILYTEDSIEENRVVELYGEGEINNNSMNYFVD